MHYSKKLFSSVAAAAAVVLFLSACSSSKQVATSTPEPGEVLIEQNKSEFLAEESPATRAYGEAVHVDRALARQYAADQARNEFASAISSKVVRASARQDVDYQKSSTTEEATKTAMDFATKRNNDFKVLVSEVVKSTPIKHTDTFRTKNGLYRVCVCIEYMGGMDALVNDVANKIQQNVSDEERLKMNFEFNQFKKEFKEELEEYQKSKGE